MVFISYKSEDVKLANDVKENLVNNGINIWMAPDSIPGGSSYPKEIHRAIKSCDILILVLTDLSQKSEWIQSEIEIARMNNKTIIPIAFSDVSYTDEFEMLLILYQRLDINKNNTKESYMNLVKRIHQIEADNSRIDKIASSSNIVSESWGPRDRKTYKWDQWSDVVSFNSITDNPTMGDERNFVRIKKVDSEDKYKGELSLESNTEYEVLVYYHNDAREGLNVDGSGISRNTSLRIRFPSYVNSGHIGVVVGFIKASNAVPEEIWDTCFLKANDNYYINFVPNSAKIFNHGTTNSMQLSGNALLNDGISLGHYDNMWGMIPAGVSYSGYITFRIKATIVVG